jgi:hypothetical protein
VLTNVFEKAASSVFTAEVKVEAAGFSRTLAGISIYQAPQRYKPEDCNLNIQHWGSLKSHFHSLLFLPSTTLAMTFIYCRHKSTVKKS